MVKIESVLGQPNRIDSEKNGNSKCQKCISDILNCLAVNDITCETAYEILHECELKISAMSDHVSLKDLL